VQSVRDFKLLSNHGSALLLIARDPQIRIRDIATGLEITERAAQRIVADLVGSGYVVRGKSGRRNLYRVQSHLRLKLPFVSDLEVAVLLSALTSTVDNTTSFVDAREPHDPSI
jgi:DNA-binding MarR family transcriptional regulator